jgi:salicylate hydroxylase
LHFADGTCAQHSAVLGCDGIKSRTRSLMLGDSKAAKAVFTGKYAYPMEKAAELLGKEQTMTTQMYIGYHAHIFTFPIANKTMLNGTIINIKNTWLPG